MRIAAIVLLVLSAILTVGGLFPCLGWVNWIGIPCSAATAIVGIVALSTKTTPENDRPIHTAALIAGLLFVCIGAVRCFLGGGLI